MQVGHAAHVLGFLSVVELFQQPVPNLLPNLVEIHLHEHADQRRKKCLQIGQICPHHPVDVRILHLDGHRPAVAQHAAIDLSDRCGGDRRRIEALEQAVEFG